MTTDTNVQNLIINTLTQEQYESIANPSSTELYLTPDNDNTSRNIGEIITSSLPLTDAGLHLLDGALIQGSGIYKGFVDYIAELYAENPDANYFCTESEWQSSVTTYGECGKFVYDETANTVRLPKITGILEGTTDVNALGDLVKAGLPVHTHTRGTMEITGYYNDVFGTSNAGVGGAITKGSNAAWTTTGGTGNLQHSKFNFTASKSWTGSTSAPVYSNAEIQSTSTVQPQTIKVFYYIVVATTSKTDAQVDIDNIATDLNGKADTDLTNTTDSGKILMSSMGMPSDKYIALTLGASESSYTAPANGWFYFLGSWSNANSYIQMTNVSNNYKVQTPQITTSGYWGLMLPISKGQVCKMFYSTKPSNVTFRFIYAKGAESEGA